MKTIKYIFSLCLVIATIWSCADDEKNVNLSAVEAPTDLAMAFDVTQDNSGTVTITPTAEGAITFDITLGDDTAESVEIENGGNLVHIYAEGTYNVTVTAYGISGLTSSLTKELIISLDPPSNLEVTIENDTTTSKQVNVTVIAEDAVNFDVYSGQTGDNTPVTANIGETAVLQYENAGLYDITIEVKGTAIQTTFFIEEDFEVTEILAPTVAAPTPPARQPGDVVSIFSDTYNNITLDEFPTSWSGASFQATTIGSDNVMRLTNFDFLGIVTNYGSGVDLSQMQTMHIDYWVPEGVTQDLEVKIVNTVDGGEDIASLGSTVAGSWQSIEIDMEEFEDGTLTNREKITQILIDYMQTPGTTDFSSIIAYIDNLYFYKEPVNPFNDGLLTNGDFELGSASWLVGVDDSTAANVVTDADGNKHYSANVAVAGNPYDVNTSQKVAITEGEIYTLKFDAWSDGNRSIIAGIGLSADPWTNVTGTMVINSTRTTYTYTTTANFSATDARVMFDLGADTGLVNIDNVALFLGYAPEPFTDGLLTNGDFELGSASWLVGVDDSTAANVVTDADGNKHYSANVAVAGNPYDVNTSQKVAITEGEIYTLKFDAWSDGNRSIIAGIGLSADPWTNVTGTMVINSTRTTYTYTTTANFSATDARVMFDLGADTGLVNIDNVSLVIEQ